MNKPFTFWAVRTCPQASEFVHRGDKSRREIPPLIPPLTRGVDLMPTVISRCQRYIPVDLNELGAATAASKKGTPACPRP
jgi:hypothetical protein